MMFTKKKLQKIRPALLKRLTALIFVFGLISGAPAISWAGVTFQNGDHVKLGYATATPPLWEVKSLPGTGVSVFLGSPVIESAFGADNDWNTSSVAAHLSGTYLPAHFSPVELAAGVLTPYGDNPVYDMNVYPAGYSGLSLKPRMTNATLLSHIPPSSAGDSLMWILDVHETQAIYNGAPDIPWDSTAGYAARLPYVAEAGGNNSLWTRSPDNLNAFSAWAIGQDGGFSTRQVSDSPLFVRPVTSPDASVMLYKRGSGTKAKPYSVCYPWQVAPAVAAKAGENTIALTFPASITNNGKWPEAGAWTITGDSGMSYSVTGTHGENDRVTLTVFPAVAKNQRLSLKYTQKFDDASQGLNNTKGAILMALAPYFAVPSMELAAMADGGGAGNGNCDCGRSDQNDGNCNCGDGGNSGCGCGAIGCGNAAGLRIVTDAVQYLVLGRPYALNLETEGSDNSGALSWTVRDGALPHGLALAEDGVVEGTPAALGSFRVTLEAAQADKTTAAKKFTFVVVEEDKLAIMTETLPNAMVGRAYSARVRGCGGIKPYVWGIDGLPAWLSFDSSSGILSGVPVVSAIHELTVRVTDGENMADARSLRLSVDAHDGLSIPAKALPAPVRGKAYSARLEAAGGIPPYFFALRRDSSLPPALSMDKDGVISGTLADATDKNVYSFTVDAMDGNVLQGSASYTLVVLDEPDLNPVSGNFTVKEGEAGQVILSFYMPPAFNDAAILGVEPVMSPAGYVMNAASSIFKGECCIMNDDLNIISQLITPKELMGCGV